MDELERENDEIDLLDYLFILLKRKRFIAAVTAGITVLTVIVSFIIPKTYKAESRIMPPPAGAKPLLASAGAVKRGGRGRHDRGGGRHQDTRAISTWDC